MDLLSLSSPAKRRARTRSLIQLGGIIEKAGLLDVFGVPLGLDLQKDPSIRDNIASLFKGLLVLKEIAASEDTNLQLWALQGLEELKSMNLSSKNKADAE